MTVRTHILVVHKANDMDTNVWLVVPGRLGGGCLEIFGVNPQIFAVFLRIVFSFEGSFEIARSMACWNSFGWARAQFTKGIYVKECPLSELQELHVLIV